MVSCEWIDCFQQAQTETKRNTNNNINKNKNDDKSNIKPSEILPYVFDDIFFLQDLNLKQDQIVGFLEYIDKKILSDELLKQSQKLQLIDFLIKESEKYIKDLSE